jgi:hypothetical protein
VPGGSQYQFLKRDGLALPVQKIGRQTTLGTVLHHELTFANPVQWFDFRPDAFDRLK